VDVPEIVANLEYMNIPFLSRRGGSTDVTVVTEKGPKLCREKAQTLVHKYAAFGTAWAILPVPIATSAGLTALETHMIYWIARTYGEEPSKSDVLMAAGGLELCSVALKTVALEGATFVPAVGWGVKAVIAGSAIEAIGQAAIRHYENKHPGKAA
jgi:uncharacterized protein (DUF697 family)